MTLRMFYSPHKAGQIHQVQSLLFQICGEILHLKRTPVKHNWIFLRALIFTTCILSFLLSATIMLPSSSTVTPLGLVNSPSLVPSEPRNWRGKKIKLQTVLKQDYPILGKANFLTWAPWKSALMTSSRWLLKSVTTAWKAKKVWLKLHHNISRSPDCPQWMKRHGGCRSASRAGHQSRT